MVTAVVIILLVAVVNVFSQSCLNTHDAGLVVQLGLKRPIDIKLLGDECRKCFWKYQYCSYEELEDCDEEFTKCSGFPEHPSSDSDLSTWEATNSQPNLFFTDSVGIDIVGVRSLRNLANGSVLVEGLTNRIVHVSQGDVVSVNAGKVDLELEGLPAENIQLSSISHRIHNNGTEIVAYLDYDERVHFAVRASRRQTWNIQQLTTAGASPAIELFDDEIHILYPHSNLTLMHWSSTDGFLATKLKTTAAVSLCHTGKRLVMLLQSVRTSGLDVSIFNPKSRRWEHPMPTSQNVDIGVAPVFTANDQEPGCPLVLFALDGRLHMMTFRNLNVSPSSWMHDLADKIGDIPLTRLLIPGSHDSGSYGITTDSALGPVEQLHQDLADLLSNPLFSQIASHVARMWSRAQGKSLFAQLHSGIRYFDFRVTSGSLAFPPISSNGDLLKDMFIEHVMISVPILDALQQIKAFLDESPKEFLIVDLQHMTGLGDKLRMSLFDEIERLFPTQKAVWNSVPSRMTLNQMWAGGYQMIFMACSESDERPWLWPRTRSLISPWPNVPDPKDLKEALVAGLASRKQDLFFVLQGVCTENVLTIAEGFLGHKPRSLRELASHTSPKVLEWFKDWPDMNIVMVDWIEDSSLVASCIQANLVLNKFLPI